MRLLFDENLSPLLITKLADLFPFSVHVHEIGLGNADDNEIWNYAKEKDFIIVTKDADFH